MWSIMQCDALCPVWQVSISTAIGPDRMQDACAHILLKPTGLHTLYMHCTKLVESRIYVPSLHLEVCL